MENVKNIPFKFISTGGAFDYEIGNSAALFRHGGQLFLIDCGFTVFASLGRAGLLGKIDAVLVTHLHDDHVGSLTGLIYYNYFYLNGKRLKIIYPNETFLEHLKGFMRYSMYPDCETYADFIPITEFQGLSAIDTYGRHVPEMPSFAFGIESDWGSAVYSGDIGDPDFLFDEMKKRNLSPDVVFHDVGYYPTVSVHAYYKHLERHLSGYTVLGYHHNHLINPSDNPIPCIGNLPNWLLNPVQDFK